jgi:hypothetical protein
MFDSDDSGLLDQLDRLPPGPELAALLWKVDRRQLNGCERVALMEARARLIAHLQADFYADMWAVTEAEARLFGEADKYRAATNEIRAALAWTRRAAERNLELARALTEALPRVGRALSEGKIDLPKARVIADAVAGIDPQAVEAVIEKVLELAPRQTTGQIYARAKRLLMSLDPEVAAKRYRASVETRTVQVYPDASGTASLSGCNLPTDRAIAAMERIEQLAESLRTKGETRTMDQLRADVFLDLLEGRPLPIHIRNRQPVIDLRIDLTTLAELDDKPAEVPGWGPVLADVARQIAESQSQAEWRVTVTHPDHGNPVWNGRTRRRPSAAQRRRVIAYNPTCVFPGCRRPATRADIDHNRPWSQGGPTTVTNLAPLCDYDHTGKDTFGWTLRQTDPGVYRWRSPLGRVYLVESQPP